MASSGSGEKQWSGGIIGTASSKLEFLYGSISGMAYGLISPFAAQPFDTLKTKMQADSRYMNQSVVSVARTMTKTEGLTSFYRGLVPILASTGVQKTALFAANAGARRACEESKIPALSAEIPGSNGLKVPVIIGGIAAGTARAVVETPFEFAKVRSQTGGTFVAAGGVFSVAQVTELYTGAFATWYRGTLMLTSFFVMCDYFERSFPALKTQPVLGGFLKGGVVATCAWAIAWPLEVVKSKVQGAEAQFKGQSTLAIVSKIVKTDGIPGLYRGFLPGALRSFTANGVGMAVYQFTQSLRKD